MTYMTTPKPKAGLEDTVATSSAICYLDGDRGVLAYCGYDIHDLARHATFEEVCYLLWHRRLPTRAELGDLQSQLVAGRALPEPIMRLMRVAARRRRHGRAAHADVDARPLRSRCGRAVAAGQLPQGGAADRAARDARRDAGAGQRRRRADPARSGARPRREFSLHADRRAAERPGDARVRRRADAARRSRAERVDVCRPRRGRDADRHPLGHRRRASAR